MLFFVISLINDNINTKVIVHLFLLADNTSDLFICRKFFPDIFLEGTFQDL